MGLPALAQEQRLSAAEYLAREMQSPERHEYFDGYLLAMAGTSQNHNRIQKNLIYLLESQFRKNSRRCEAFASDARLQVSESRYFYPDVSIYCAKPETDDKNNFKNPTVVIEILSPTTENFDRGEKSASYRKLPSLQQIVLVNPATRSVESYERQAEGELWLFREAAGSSGSIDIAGVECPLQEIFFNLEAEAVASA